MNGARTALALIVTNPLPSALKGIFEHTASTRTSFKCVFAAYVVCSWLVGQIHLSFFRLAAPCVTVFAQGAVRSFNRDFRLISMLRDHVRKTENNRKGFRSIYFANWH